MTKTSATEKNMERCMSRYFGKNMVSEEKETKKKQFSKTMRSRNTIEQIHGKNYFFETYG